MRSFVDISAGLLVHIAGVPEHSMVSADACADYVSSAAASGGILRPQGTASKPV